MPVFLREVGGGRKSDGTREAEVRVMSGRGHELRNAGRLYGVWYNIASVLCFVFLAPSHVQSCFPSQDQTCTPCIGRQDFNHWTAREVLQGGKSL